MLATLLVIAVAQAPMPMAGEHFKLVTGVPPWSSIASLGDKAFGEFGLLPIASHEGKRLQIIDLETRRLLDPTWSHAHPISRDAIVAKPLEEGAGWAIFDRKGEVLVQGKYATVHNKPSSKLADFTKIVQRVNDGAFVFRTGEKEYAVYSPGGERLTEDYELLLAFTEDTVAAVKGGKIGIIGVDGKTVLPFEYVDFCLPSDGLLIAATGQNRYGVVKMDGSVVVPFEYAHLSPLGDGYALASKGPKQAGVIRLDGTVVVPLAYEQISSISGGHVSWSRNGKSHWGISSLETGKVVFDGGTVYGAILPLFGRFFKTVGPTSTSTERSKGYKFRPCGIVDATRGVIAPPQYVRVEAGGAPGAPLFLLSKDMAGLQKDVMGPDGKVSLVDFEAGTRNLQDIDGKTVLSGKSAGRQSPIRGSSFTIHDRDVARYSEGLAWARLDGKKGYVDTNQRFVLEIEDAITGEKFLGGWAILVRDLRKRGVIDRKGRFVVPPRFDRIERHPLRHDIVSVRTEDELWGVYDTSGRELFKPAAGDISFFGKDHFVARVKGSKKRTLIYKLK